MSILERKISPYGICMVIAIFLVTVLTYKKSKTKGVKIESILIVMATTVGFAIFCGELLYIFVTYSFEEILVYIKNFDFRFIKTGGIVFYGGLIGGMLGAYLGSIIANIKLSEIESACVPFIPLGHAIGRLGCFFAKCCYGFAYEGPLAIVLSDGNSYFPIQLIEAFLNVVIAIYLLHYSKITREKYDIISKYLLCYAIARFILEFFRGDMIRGIYCHLSTSQWISIGIIFACLFKKIFKYFKCPKEEKMCNK